jgi:hypothetical protein
MKALIPILIGLLVGGGSVGFFWWRDNQHANVKSPYWDVQSTDPAYWQHDARDKNGWKLGDMDDCHGLVAWMHSHQYMKWESRVDRFSSCMRRKGYKFIAQEEANGAKEESDSSSSDSLPAN